MKLSRNKIKSNQISFLSDFLISMITNNRVKILSMPCKATVILPQTATGIFFFISYPEKKCFVKNIFTRS